MRDKEFEELCLGVVSSEALPVVAQQLLLNGQLAKTGTEFGYEVVKLSPSKTKGLEVTDVDIGIIRCAILYLTCFLHAVPALKFL